MSENGDKQPLTPADQGDGLANVPKKKRKSITSLFSEKFGRLSGSKHKEAEKEPDPGWQNPSYEMSEVKHNDTTKDDEESKPNKKGDAPPVKSKRTKKSLRRRDPSSAASKSAEEEGMEMEEKLSNPRGQHDTVSVIDETTTAPDRDKPTRPRRKHGRRGRQSRGTEAPGGSCSGAVDDQQVLALLIQRAERLDGARWQLARPMVRVHLLDTDSGQTVRKQDPRRRVSYYYEPDGVDTILPVMTRPADAAVDDALLWNDPVIFNEPFGYLTGAAPRVCVVFELLTSSPETPELSCAGWAFLRLLGAGGRDNTGQPLRLQLFRPPADRSLRAKPAHTWWKLARRNKLPATLHMMARPVTPPKPEPGIRSLVATQAERGRSSSPAEPERHDSDQAPPPVSWSRLAGQTCRLPTVSSLTLADDAEACQTLRFDADGHRLACGVQRASQYPVLVYQIPSGTRVHALVGHSATVYDLAWRGDSLLSASADWTVRLWHLQESGVHTETVLPHPGYVYTAVFHSATPRHIVTGCVDGVLRVWRTSGKQPPSEPRLCQEVTVSQTAINTLCWSADSGTLYGGDAAGQLCECSWTTTGKHKTPHMELVRCVKPDQLQGGAINQISLHMSGLRLFVQARGGIIAAVDTTYLKPLRLLTGHLNGRGLLRGCLTPCGTYYLSGSEDGCLHVWSADTGDRCATYTALGSTRPVVCVHFHPWEHMLAVATHRDPRVTVQALAFDRCSTGEQLGLVLLPRAIQPAPDQDCHSTPAASVPPRLLPPLPLTAAPDRAPSTAEHDNKFQLILDRLDSVIEVARAGDMSRLSAASAPERLGRSFDAQVDQTPTQVHSAKRQRRRDRKLQQQLNRTNPTV